MKTLVVSTLALAAMTSVALAGAPAADKATAGPTKLTAAQMDRVSAGFFNQNFNQNQNQQGFGQAQCQTQCGSRGNSVGEFGNFSFGF